MSAPIRVTAAQPLSSWHAKVEADRARMAADRAARPPRRESPALQAAIAEMQGHARRWVQARRDTLFETGSDAAPCRDVRLDLGGSHALDRADHSVRAEP